MAGEGFSMHAAQSMKANTKLRNKRRSFKDISESYKSEEMSNQAVFDRKVKQEYLRKEAIAFYVIGFIVFSLSLALVLYIL